MTELKMQAAPLKTFGKCIVTDYHFPRSGIWFSPQNNNCQILAIIKECNEIKNISWLNTIHHSVFVISSLNAVGFSSGEI